jgi:hypothetical protein
MMYRVDLADGGVEKVGAEEAELRRRKRTGDDLSAFVDGLVADFTGNPAAEQERDDFPEPHAGLDEFMARIAARDDGALPESVREDAELQDALRAQAHDDHFGDAYGDNLSDEEAWSQYRRAIGEEA